MLGGGGDALPGSGPLLLVMDNGFAAGPDWPARLAAANSLLDTAERQGRHVSLLATAASLQPLRATAPQPAALLRPRLAALLPQPWGVDRRAAAKALGDLPPGPTAYVADGLTMPPLPRHSRHAAM
jgi:hypothetical protein